MLGNRPCGGQEVEDSQGEAGESGVLEQGDELTDLGGDDVSQRLGQDNQSHLFRWSEANGLGRLFLASRHRLETTTNDLRDVRGGEQGEGHDRSDNLRGGEGRRDKEFQRDIGHQQEDV